MNYGRTNQCGIDWDDRAGAWWSKLTIGDLKSFWGALGWPGGRFEQGACSGYTKCGDTPEPVARLLDNPIILLSRSST
jgi:hypothetical protein